MNIDEVYRYVNTMVNKFQNGSLTSNEFNIIATIAQEEIYDQLVGGRDSKTTGNSLGVRTNSGPGFSQKLLDELAPVTVVASMDINSDGVFQLPDDYQHTLNMYVVAPKPLEGNNRCDTKSITLINPIRQLKLGEYYQVESNSVLPLTIGSQLLAIGHVFVYTGQSISGQGVVQQVEVDYNIVDILGAGKIFNRINSAISPATEQYPVAQIKGRIVEVWPKTITTVQIEYLRKLRNPEWAYTIENNLQVYDPLNSTNFELGESTHTDITNKILQKYGVSINSMNAAMYAQSNNT